MLQQSVRHAFSVPLRTPYVCPSCTLASTYLDHVYRRRTYFLRSRLLATDSSTAVSENSDEADLIHLPRVPRRTKPVPGPIGHGQKLDAGQTKASDAKRPGEAKNARRRISRKAGLVNSTGGEAAPLEGQEPSSAQHVESHPGDVESEKIALPEERNASKDMRNRGERGLVEQTEREKRDKRKEELKQPEETTGLETTSKKAQRTTTYKESVKRNVSKRLNKLMAGKHLEFKQMHFLINQLRATFIGRRTRSRKGIRGQNFENQPRGTLSDRGKSLLQHDGTMSQAPKEEQTMKQEQILKAEKIPQAEPTMEESTDLEQREDNIVLSETLPRGFRRSVNLDEVEIAPQDLELISLDHEIPPIPRLAHNLDKVLFNPGVFHLRDPRSRVYNFDPDLEMIMPVDKFDFNTVRSFTPSSKDEKLLEIAKKAQKKYIGSTSSMTGVLRHFHYLLSAWRPLNYESFSKGFSAVHPNFSLIQRAPDSIFLRWNHGTYALDSDKEFDDANILSMMGRFMEKLLTVDKETFERHRVDSQNRMSEAEKESDEAFHYSTVGDFVMRSQLDAYDPRLPGTGVFDLKTRAVCPIRMDSKDFAWGMDYEIQSALGEWQSFEREYYDMTRATMLKYSLQVRMGRMDGIFVAYHNIARIFGFQYISLEDMDHVLHGQTDKCLGDQEFLASIKLLNQILDRAAAKFPEQSLRIHFETRDAKEPFMYIYAEPVTEEGMAAIQSKNQASIQAWENAILGLVERDSGEVVRDTTAPETFSERIRRFRTSPTPHPALLKTYHDSPPAATPPEYTDTSTTPAAGFAPAYDDPAPDGPLLGMLLHVRNRVNGREVVRPTALEEGDRWAVQYALCDMAIDRAQLGQRYQAMMSRRRKLLASEARERYNYFIELLRSKARESRRWREEMDLKDEGRGGEKKVVGWAVGG